MCFQGDVWETDDTYKKLRNLFNDFFFENNPATEGIDIAQIMRVLIIFSVYETNTDPQEKKISMKVYEVSV